MTPLLSCNVQNNKLLFLIMLLCHQSFLCMHEKGSPISKKSESSEQRQCFNEDVRREFFNQEIKSNAPNTVYGIFIIDRLTSSVLLRDGQKPANLSWNIPSQYIRITSLTPVQYVTNIAREEANLEVSGVNFETFSSQSHLKFGEPDQTNSLLFSTADFAEATEPTKGIQCPKKSWRWVHKDNLKDHVSQEKLAELYAILAKYKL